MSRLLGTILFLSLLCVASDCNAQRLRGWLSRGARTHQGATIQPGHRPAQPFHLNHVPPSQLQQPTPAHLQEPNDIRVPKASALRLLERELQPAAEQTPNQIRQPEPIQVQQSAPHQVQQSAPRRFWQPRARRTPRNIDPDNWRFDSVDMYSKYPKYIGGFHSSYYSNLGLPSGDIGFRGNGIYWAPW